jgi:hypothetical protein
MIPTHESVKRSIEGMMKPVLSLEAKKLRWVERRKLKPVWHHDFHDLLDAGMKINECHQNCDFQQRANPKCKIVTGWLLHDNPDMGRVYHLHSVIKIPAQGLVCVTPNPTHTNVPSWFIPDPDYRVLKKDGKVIPYYKGQAAQTRTLRSNPEKIQALGRTMLEQMEAGATVEELFGL